MRLHSTAASPGRPLQFRNIAAPDHRGLDHPTAATSGPCGPLPDRDPTLPPRLPRGSQIRDHVLEGRKVIDLDDLLSDFYSKKNEVVKSGSKMPSMSKGSISDDEDEKTQKNKEIKVSKIVDNFQKQVNEMSTEDEITSWGQRIFGHQRPPPPPYLAGSERCEFLQSFAENKLNSMINLGDEQGESFLEGLLLNGWLLKLSFLSGFVEDSIASWTFYKMLYSSNRELQVSASEFWCGILLSKNESMVKLEWLPSYSQLKDALEIYGYLPDATTDCQSSSKEVDPVSANEGPPENIRSWIKVLSSCFQIRNVRCMFSASEAEDLLVVIIRLSLDCRLQGLLLVSHECMQSIIDFFSEEEWDSCCNKVAESIAFRVPKDLNCLRVVESISGASIRSKRLRSQVALEILVICFDKRAANWKEVVQVLMLMNVKDKTCNFLKLYMYLVLAENVLLGPHSLSVEGSLVTIDVWCKYLRNCSSQITSTDWRPFASKVRNKASYLLQNSMQRRNNE